MGVLHPPKRCKKELFRQADRMIGLRTARDATMTEITYFEQVRCELSPGLRDDHLTACVTDDEGRTQYLDVTPTMINRHEGVPFIPVGFVQIDRERRRVLVEFPCEAYSGANRAWIPFENLRHEDRPIP